MKLRIATCQFPVDSEVERNAAWIERQMRRARRGRADVAHFSECALSGYAGKEITSFRGYDWAPLEKATRRIMALAAELRLWVLLGSSHRLGPGHKPHNSVYVIDDRGRLRDRYDKLFCTGDPSEKRDDLRHYSPGDHFTVFEVKGFRCGILICHDFRYPELYREYLRRGVSVLFHSYHNGHCRKSELRGRRNIWGVAVPAVMQAYAANNHLWVSANNTCRPESAWPSFFVRPDGIVAGRLAQHRPGVLLSLVDTSEKIPDSSVHWRPRAMKGVYHSGTLVKDPRSRSRTRL